MSNIIRLAFKDNPVPGTDDYIDLRPDSSPGPLFQSYDQGEPYFSPQYNRDVRDITIAFHLKGSSADDLTARLAKMRTWLERTKQFLQSFRGNIPATYDGTWFPGDALTLTFQANSATKIAFWNVLEGEVIEPANIIQYISQYLIENVQMRLTVDATPRGNRVRLQNMVTAGDLRLPDAADGATASVATLWPPNWYVTNQNYQVVSNAYLAANLPAVLTNFPLAGANVASYQASTGFTDELRTNGSGNLFNGWGEGAGTNVTSIKVVPQIWAYFGTTSMPTGNISCYLESYNGSSWVQLATLFNIGSTGGGAAPATAGWKLYTTPAVTVNNPLYYGNNQVRLRIVATNYSGSQPACYFTGFGIWVNPIGNTAPTEFLSSGNTAGRMFANIYNVQGDAPAPVTMTFGAGNYTTYAWLVGGRRINFDNDYPIKPLFLRNANPVGGAGSDLALIWGAALAGDNPTSGTSSKTITLGQNVTKQTFDKIPRRYLVLAYYAANDYNPIKSVQLAIDSGGYYSLPNTMPATYTGNAAYTDANYDLAVLGEMWWPQQGSYWANVNTNALNPVLKVNYTNTVDSTGNTKLSVGGLIMLPLEQFASLDGQGQTLTQSAGNAIALTTETTVLSAFSADLQRPLSAVVAGNDLRLIPGAGMQYFFIPSSTIDYTKSPVLLSMASPAQQTDLRVEYTPRYRGGV